MFDIYKDEENIQEDKSQNDIFWTLRNFLDQ